MSTSKQSKNAEGVEWSKFDIDEVSRLESQVKELWSQGKKEEAEEACLKAIEMKTRMIGANCPDTAFSLFVLGTICRDQDKRENAAQAYEQALAIFAQTLGFKHPATAACLNNLAHIYNIEGLYLQAEALFLRELEIYREVQAESDPHVADTMSSLAMLYLDQGRLKDAEQLCQQALMICSQTLGADHPATARKLNNLAEIHKAQGYYLRAESLYLQALEIYDQTPESTHLAIAVSLNNLGSLYLAQGRYTSAEKLLKRALAIRYQDGGSDAEIATSLDNLASLYFTQGRHDHAEPLFQQALAIFEKAQGKEDIDTAVCLDNLASLYAAQGDRETAEGLMSQALAIHVKSLGPSHPTTVTSLANLASFYFSQGRYAEAEPLCKQALTLRIQLAGPTHPTTATSLAALASIYLEQGKYTESQHLFRQALEIHSRTLGVGHPDTISCIANLALLYIAQGEPALALTSATDALKNETEHLLRELPLLPVQSRPALLRTLETCRELSFLLATKYPLAAKCALDARLHRHGLLQEIERHHYELFRHSGVDQIQLDCLAGLITALASTTLQPATRAALMEERDQLESELFQRYPDAGLHPVQIADVAAVLPLNAVLVEIERVAAMDRYLAITLRPDASVGLVDLGPVRELEEMVEAALLSSSSGFADSSELWAEVSKLIVGPLLEHFCDVHHWILSVDGALHRIPFAALPWPGEPERWLCDAIEITLLTSGRDLIRLNHRSADTGPSLVLANPHFDQHIEPSPDPGSEVAKRSRDLGSLGHWQLLPGTAEEGQRIAELLDAQLLTEAEATTINIQGTKRPLILHAATHGYFLPDEPKPVQVGSSFDFNRSALLANFHGEDPMLRSGLVLAGANHPDANPHDDGYLTALETSHLDLQGTELVTLSACDTGRGDIQTGEGVYGLQRALVMAGARSMLLSLWKVPDDATCEFMVRYYSFLKQGAGRLEALITVQREFREHENVIWRDPYFWAAWQLVGDWKPIENIGAPAVQAQ